ncbi:hypothetical protein EDC45_0363 [Mesocricetibacter intestinalis]|uniref:Uncharacterized protein n=1 Tax=Mesocricetibacter intestinalis TaxID=1521930 RepID=A0A4R6VFD9_9PAST|nr:hypothetical protein [Mesocricetibacter intestinalis]TDQ59705.1 hypothetical protein EDC45_0363 [Mesocricetibacter intestinalis]
MKDYKKCLSALFLSACLAACSGGGGNNAPQNPPRSNQPPQQIPPSQSPDKKPEQPQSPESGKKPEQPKLPDSERNPQQPPKVEAPQVEAQGYFTETVNSKGINKDMYWNNASDISKDSIPVYNISFTRNGEKVINKKESVRVKAPVVNNEFSYELSLLGERGFFGYYTDLNENNNIFLNFAYGFDRTLENSVLPSDITATYKKKGGFLYTVAQMIGNGNLGYDGVFKSDVSIKFHNGKISQGEITYPNLGVKQFDIKQGSSVKQFIITPTDSFLNENRGIKLDKGVADIHYLNSSKGTNDYKYLVGSVKAENWYGVLAAEKQ